MAHKDDQNSSENGASHKRAEDSQKKRKKRQKESKEKKDLKFFCYGLLPLSGKRTPKVKRGPNGGTIRSAKNLQLLFKIAEDRSWIDNNQFMINQWRLFMRTFYPDFKDFKDAHLQPRFEEHLEVRIKEYFKT